MNPVFIGIPIALVITLALLIPFIRKNSQSNNDDLMDYIDELLNEIEQLEIYRNSLIGDCESIKHGVFPRIIDSVLDEYEQSNIRIPADILEELSRNGFIDESDVRTFIENQRHHWKLENSKRVYKK